MVGEFKRYQKAALTDNFYAPSVIWVKLALAFFTTEFTERHRVPKCMSL